MAWPARTVPAALARLRVSETATLLEAVTRVIMPLSADISHVPVCARAGWGAQPGSPPHERQSYELLRGPAQDSCEARGAFWTHDLATLFNVAEVGCRRLEFLGKGDLRHFLTESNRLQETAQGQRPPRSLFQKFHRLALLSTHAWIPPRRKQIRFRRQSLGHRLPDRRGSIELTADPADRRAKAHRD